MAFNQGHALVIGVGTYLYAPNANVPITVVDAQRVMEVLCNQDFGGYLSERVTFLHDETATRDGILTALDQLATAPSKDTVLLFYSGHGAYATDGNYCLTTHDTRLSGDRVLKGTGVSEIELMAKLRAIPAKRLLLLFNACHSGEISPDLGLEEDRKVFGDLSLPEKSADAILSTGEGRIIITACRPDQKSYIGSGKVTIFAQALVDGLMGKGYVSNNSGYISAFGLYEHVYATVVEKSGKLQQVQEPELTVLRNVGPFPVALYRGASDLGTFTANSELPSGTAARAVEPMHSQRLLKQIIASSKGSVAIGGRVSDSNIITGDNNVVQTARGRNVAQSGRSGTAEVVDNSRRTIFDQRGQHVKGNQYNAGGDMDFGAVSSQAEGLAELRKLLDEVRRAAQANVLDQEAGTDAEYQVKKAVQQAEKPDADKDTILDHLANAKEIIAGVATNVAAATGLAAAIGQAIQMVQRLFT